MCDMGAILAGSSLSLSLLHVKKIKNLKEILKHKMSISKLVIQEDINISSRGTDRDWTFGHISSSTESCHIGTHFRHMLSMLIHS